MRAAPSTYHEAISSQDAHFQKLAMDEETSALNDNETYELTTPPKEKNVIGGCWVLFCEARYKQ